MSPRIILTDQVQNDEIAPEGCISVYLTALGQGSLTQPAHAGALEDAGERGPHGLDRAEPTSGPARRQTRGKPDRIRDGPGLGDDGSVDILTRACKLHGARVIPP